MDIECARLNDLTGVRELNTLLKIQLKNPVKNMGVKDFYWNTDPYIRAAITEKRCFIIKDGAITMAAMIMEHRNPENQYPYQSLAVGTLSVHPEFRRNGLGIQLVSHAKAMARKEKKRLYVESFIEFRQLSFYKRLGFTGYPLRSSRVRFTHRGKA
ncbi:MAG: GNAT family N-acetyltransferase [Desulfobacteraceae bacterium]|nr:GNAT family N-acetyltransferase [Desulfobacteraceae bacterium]MBC2756958.1 GNAT family N-acetyltransferase [Desulfobacteraceae bacterium]